MDMPAPGKHEGGAGEQLHAPTGTCRSCGGCPAPPAGDARQPRHVRGMTLDWQAVGISWPEGLFHEAARTNQALPVGAPRTPK
ncbi:hypothetical protein J2T21_000187 [Paeniglutamicibacter psychrophenolicus]|nr:hypothetical protein [Paeniglutamicibacter psychrophenolicus]